jgi:hypothetical protein
MNKQKKISTPESQANVSLFVSIYNGGNGKSFSIAAK